MYCCSMDQTAIPLIKVATQEAGHLNVTHHCTRVWLRGEVGRLLLLRRARQQEYRFHTGSGTEKPVWMGH